jgi:hypothetical protein
MGSFSDYLEAKVLDHVFGATTYTPPATVYFALFTAAPSDSGGGTEVTGGAYARKSVTNNTTNWANSTGTTSTKALAVAQAFATASGANWGTITHFGIFDASTSGNLLVWGALGTSEVINDGGTLTVPVGQPVITLD